MQMKQNLIASSIAAAICTTATISQITIASDIFSSNLTITNCTCNGSEQTTEYFSYQKVEDLLDSIQESNLIALENLEGVYKKGRSGVNADMYYRGIPINISYKEGSSTLQFAIAALDVKKEFDGINRDQAEEKFRNYFEENGDGLLTDMLQMLVATTSTDPIAGNPNALTNRMAADDARSPFSTGLFALEAASSPFGSTVSIGKYTGTNTTLTEGKDHDITLLSIPFEYNYRFEDDPRKQIHLSMPLTYMDVDGGKAYDASFGVGYRHPISDDWAITPGVRVGALGSVDLGSAAIVYSASVKSAYTLYHDDLAITINNLLGIYQTAAIDAGDAQVDYDLTNQITRNGVSVEGPTSKTMFGKPTSWQAALNHSYVMGDEVFIDSYFDLVLSFGTRYSDAGDEWNTFRFGLSATFGNNDYKGFGINFGYVF
jgi:hypothetical protein